MYTLSIHNNSLSDGEGHLRSVFPRDASQTNSLSALSTGIARLLPASHALEPLRANRTESFFNNLFCHPLSNQRAEERSQTRRRTACKFHEAVNRHFALKLSAIAETGQAESFFRGFFCRLRQIRTLKNDSSEKRPMGHGSWLPPSGVMKKADKHALRPIRTFYPTFASAGKRAAAAQAAT